MLRIFEIGSKSSLLLFARASRIIKMKDINTRVKNLTLGKRYSRWECLGPESIERLEEHYGSVSSYAADRGFDSQENSIDLEELA